MMDLQRAGVVLAALQKDQAFQDEALALYAREGVQPARQKVERYLRTQGLNEATAYCLAVAWILGVSSTIEWAVRCADKK